jgi:predicted CxxxxCH...CXXCH cytochrome family protein
MATRWLPAVVLAAAAAAGGACGFDSPPPDIPPPNAEPRLGCAIDCHGDDSSSAPPRSTSGVTETTSVAVGAHRVHMNVAPTWHRQIACEDCHVVPDKVDSPGHNDGKVDMIFGLIAGPGAAWNGTTCTTKCHGSTLLGGAQPTPTWTRVDGTQVTCGSCHGRPPPAPHPPNPNCASCHPTMEEGSMTFRDPESHIDGIVQQVPAGTCTMCHGSPTSSAPPNDLHGGSSKTTRGVGAHTAHLMTSDWHRAVACSSCHKVPLMVTSPGHMDGITQVVFTPLNPAAVYTTGTAKCTNLYCHGNGRGNNGTATWINPGALGCTACHSTNGTNMSGAHRTHIADHGIKCAQCHGTVVDVNQKIINANLHINGAHEIKMANGTWDASRGRCQNVGCHGTKDWDGKAQDGPGGEAGPRGGR